MKIRRITAMTAVCAAVSLATPAFALLPGLATPVTEPDTAVRPSDKPQHSEVVQPSGPIRGSLYKIAAQAPVPVGPDGKQVGGSPLDFTEVGNAKPKKFQKNDIVQIIVAVNSATASNSQNQIEKKQNFDMAVQQFVQLATNASGLPSVGVVGQPSKLPEVKFSYDNNRQNTAQQQRSDTFNDKFSAEVVDVKPNGTMTIEAVQQVTIDKEVLQYTLSGICRIEDVTPDNTVLSTQLAHLNLSKKTTGEVHDGTRGGWLNGLIDKFNPF